MNMRRILPHLCLVMSLMMLVFYVIDRFNSAMHFIGGNEVFNTFLLIFSVTVLIQSIRTIAEHRRGSRAQTRSDNRAGQTAQSEKPRRYRP